MLPFTGNDKYLTKKTNDWYQEWDLKAEINSRKSCQTRNCLIEKFLLIAELFHENIDPLFAPPGGRGSSQTLWEKEKNVGN